MDQAGIPVYMTPLATGVISFIAFMPDFALPPIFGASLDKAAAAGNIASGFQYDFLDHNCIFRNGHCWQYFID